MTDAELQVRESGLGESVPPPVGVLPPNSGQWPVPSWETFLGVVNLQTRTHRWSFDEALKQNPGIAEALENDLVIEEALSSRMRPVAQLSWHLKEQNETDPKQVEAKVLVTKIIEQIPYFQAMRFSLLRAAWFGRMGAQLTYKWDSIDGKSVWVVKAHRPVLGDKLVFRFSGDVGFLVGSQYKGETVSAADGRYATHFLTPAERQSVIIHRYERRDRSFTEFTMSGAIEGSGIRDRVYQYWAMKVSFLANLSDFADRFGSGLWNAYYDLSNPASKAEVEATIAAYRTNRVMLWPRTLDGKTPYGVEVREVGTQNPAFLLELINNYFDRYIRLYVLGRAAALEGIGGDEAGLHEDSLATVQKFDASLLDETLTQDLVKVLYQLNCPGVPHAKFKSNVDTPNAAEELQNAEVLKGLGADLDLDYLYSVAGMPKPQPGSNIASAAQPLSPMAVQGVPQGTPVAGQPGPVPQVASQQAPPQDTSPQPTILDD